MSNDATPPLSIDLLDRYFAGECTPDECRIVEHQIVTIPDLQFVREQLARGETTERDVALAWHRFKHARLPQATAAARHTAKPRSVLRTGSRGMLRRQDVERSVWRRWRVALVSVAGLAAAMIVAVLGGAHLRRPTASAALQQTVSTARGQRSVIDLPDGTHVILGVASRLTYSAGFGVTSRDVTLDGEALFDVSHAAAMPFTVHVAGTKATVLGTTFSVRKYSDDTASRIVVASGRVEVDDAVLQAGDVALHSAHRLQITHDADTDALFAWTTGRLVFTGTPLRDVLHDLSRWRDVQFRYDSTLGNEPVGLTIRDGSADDAARLLAVTVGATMERAGDTITLTTKRHHDR